MSDAIWSANSVEPLAGPVPILVPRPVSDRGLRRIRVGLLGCGRIGQAVVATARAERERLAAAGVELTFVRALVRDLTKARAVAVPVVDAASRFAVEDLDVLVEVLGGTDPAGTLVARALAAGVPVVSANKTLIAREGGRLEALARRHAAVLAYDAAVLAGVPFLGSLARRPLLSGADRLTGIVNGTSHAITTALESGVPFAEALADAVARGYAEPDSSADISGRDAAEKLTILLRLAGVPGVLVDQLTTVGIDSLTPADFAAARALGGTIKPIALAVLHADQPGAWVGPAFVDQDLPLARATGVTNVLQIGGAAGRAAFDVPDVIFQGPGAGPAATAATIIDDVVEAIEARPARRPAAERAACDLSLPPAGRWFLRWAGDSTPTLPLVRATRLTTGSAALTGLVGWREVAHAQAVSAASGIELIAYPACCQS